MILIQVIGGNQRRPDLALRNAFSASWTLRLASATPSR
jgi:hypothetical protein